MTLRDLQSPQMTHPRSSSVLQGQERNETPRQALKALVSRRLLSESCLERRLRGNLSTSGLGVPFELCG